VLCVHDIIDYPLSTVVMTFSRVLGTALSELSTHADLVIDDNASIEGNRQSFIMKLLADADPVGTTSSVPISTSTATKGKHLWGSTALSNDGILVPFSAENRRREDVYKAFAIALLYHTSTDGDVQRNYKSQLESIANGTKAARRFSARSRFRASQGLYYLNLMGEDNFGGLRRYLFCLSEMLETRLQCSEESLALAVGYSASGSLSPNPVSLVRTWMRDEGGLAQAMELGRDVLVVATETMQNVDVTKDTLINFNTELVMLWVDLLRHMDQVLDRHTVLFIIFKFLKCISCCNFSATKINPCCTLLSSFANSPF
jgi:hypothetical protein